MTDARTGVETTTVTLPVLPDDDTGYETPTLCTRVPGGATQGTILWCHGLGGSGVDGTDLAETWARAGFLVVRPTFPDSLGHAVVEHPELAELVDGHDVESLVQSPQALLFMVTKMLEWPWRFRRIRILHHLVDELDAIVDRREPTDSGPLRERIGIGGHSFGAYTAQLLAGATISCPLGPDVSFASDRIRALVIASGQGRDQAGLHTGSWRQLEVPLLNITGTLDRGATTDDPNWKCEPFEFAASLTKYQMVFDGANHALGGISGGASSPGHDPSMLRHIEELTTQFWNAHLAGDRKAREWLSSDDANQLLSPVGRYDARG